MIKPNLNSALLDDILSKLKLKKSQTEGDLKTLAQDIANSIIQRYHLVTQEEFEAQRKTLATAQEKLAILEKRLAELEKK